MRTSRKVLLVLATTLVAAPRSFQSWIHRRGVGGGPGKFPAASKTLPPSTHPSPGKAPSPASSHIFRSFS